MAAAFASAENRTQAALSRLEALENDNAGIETVEMNDDDDEAFLDDDDNEGLTATLTVFPDKTNEAFKGNKTLNRKAPRSFLELLNEANLESLTPRVPSYLRAAVGPPSSTSGHQFCPVCGFTASFTCARCGLRFCCISCQNIHDDPRCVKFVA